MKEVVEDAAQKADAGDLVHIPGLGSRPVVQQQRTLFMLLGLALLVLAVVTLRIESIRQKWRSNWVRPVSADGVPTSR